MKTILCIFAILTIIVITSADPVFVNQCTEGQVITKSDFKFICKSGSFKPHACSVTGDDGSSVVDIPVGSTKSIKGFWVKCELDGNTLRYIREPRCVVKNKSYHINETLKIDSVIYQCLGDSIKPIGCYFLDSKNKEIKAQLGQTVLIDHVQHRCRSVVPDQALNTSCVVNGKTYNVGDKWDGGEGFFYTCSSDGYISISECIIEPGVGVKVDEKRVYKNHLHSCIKSDTGIRYTSQPCDTPGVNCNGAITIPNQDPVKNDASGDVTCKVEGKVIKAGEKQPVDKGFVFQCMPDGSLTISDCVLSPGVYLQVGTTLVKNNRLHKCVKTDHGTVQYTSEPCGPNAPCAIGSTAITGPVISSDDKPILEAGKACIKDGASHVVGETWFAKGFKYLCMAPGRTTVVACATEDNTEIPIGGSLKINKTYHNCELKPNGSISHSYTQCSSDTDCP